MDRLVVSDIKEVKLTFKRGEQSSAMFRLTNLMHTMHVAISLTTTNSSLFSFSSPFSVLPPLSTSSFTVFLPDNHHHPPLTSPPHSITVRSSMLPLGKQVQNVNHLRRLFSRVGKHIFNDVVLPISFVGSHVVEFLVLSSSSSSTYLKQHPEIAFWLQKAISGCTRSQLTSLLGPACKGGNMDFVKELVEAGGDINHRNLDSESILSIEVRSGNVEIVKFLIASGCKIDNSIDRVLHNAAGKNRVDLMKILCMEFKKIDVNMVDPEGRSALHVAAVRGHVESLRFLTSIGGDSNIADKHKWTPLHFAASQGHAKAVKFLLNNTSSFTKNAITEEGKTAFELAVDNDHVDLYAMLRLGDVLQRAAATCDVNGLKSRILDGVSVNERDQNGWTSLHRAAFKGRIENVKALIGYGAEVDAGDDAAYTPLHCAVEATVAMCLKSHGAKANVNSIVECLKDRTAVVVLHPSRRKERP